MIDFENIFGIPYSIETIIYCLVLACGCLFLGMFTHREEKIGSKLFLIAGLLLLIVIITKYNLIAFSKNTLIGVSLATYFVGYIGSALYYYSLSSGYNPKDDIMLYNTNNYPIVIKNFKRGVGVFGSSGSAKTQGVLYPIMLSLKEKQIGGLIYDYKKGELTEIVKGIFEKDRVHVFCFDDIDTIRINFLDPDFLKTEKDVVSICNTFLNTAFGKDAVSGKNAYFYNSAKSIFIGVALRFYFDYREFCSFANIILFLTANDFSFEETIGKKTQINPYRGIIDFIDGNQWSKTQGANGISALRSGSESSDTMSTLLSALSRFSSPTILFPLGENTIDLRINLTKDIVVLVNTPKDDEFYESIFSCIFDVIAKNLMERSQNEAFLLLDEAHTIKSEKMSRIISTMRSFGIAIFYCCQDVSQGYLQYTRDGFRSILANMSTMFFGKVNEPETAKFCEGYIDEMKVQEKSHTTGKTGSTTTSTRDRKRIKESDFFKLKQGEFVVTSDGKIKRQKMKRYKIKKVPYNPSLNENNRKAIDIFYENSVNNIISFAKKIGVSK